MHRLPRVTAMLIAVCAAIGLSSVVGANDDHGPRRVSAHLKAKNEVPPIFTAAEGRFTGEINRDGTAVDWTLSYDGLEGTVTQAHIHAAPKNVNGGIMVWFCSNLTSPPTPAGVPACPAPPATISGTFEAADVVGPAAQAISAGDFEEFLQALRNGLAYANVHSTLAPGGELRGQIKRGGGDRH